MKSGLQMSGQKKKKRLIIYHKVPELLIQNESFHYLHHM